MFWRYIHAAQRTYIAKRGVQRISGAAIGPRRRAVSTSYSSTVLSTTYLTMSARKRSKAPHPTTGDAATTIEALNGELAAARAAREAEQAAAEEQLAAARAAREAEQAQLRAIQTAAEEERRRAEERLRATLRAIQERLRAIQERLQAADQRVQEVERRLLHQHRQQGHVGLTGLALSLIHI